MAISLANRSDRVPALLTSFDALHKEQAIGVVKRKHGRLEGKFVLPEWDERKNEINHSLGQTLTFDANANFRGAPPARWVTSF